ncbi:MAG: hypothetical protein AAFU53_14180, partial [Cyanobacteria bacterium J06632_3]
AETQNTLSIPPKPRLKLRTFWQAGIAWFRIRRTSSAGRSKTTFWWAQNGEANDMLEKTKRPFSRGPVKGSWRWGRFSCNTLALQYTKLNQPLSGQKIAKAKKSSELKTKL